jgi:type IV pilus assembly protein PilM
MVGNALAAVKAAGLDVQMVDLTSFAVLRSMVGEGAVASPSSEALVDVGASVTNIVVHQGGVPRFVRILMLGGADITNAVAERLGVPQDQAEAVKQQTGLAQVPSTEAHPAQRAIEASGSAFVDEVRGSLDYFMAQPGASRIDRIVLSGGGSLLAGLAERLQAATRLPVHAARPMAQLKIGKTGLTPEQLAYVEPMVTVPVGLAMGVS